MAAAEPKSGDKQAGRQAGKQAGRQASKRQIGCVVQIEPLLSLVEQAGWQVQRFLFFFFFICFVGIATDRSTKACTQGQGQSRLVSALCLRGHYTP